MRFHLSIYLLALLCAPLCAADFMIVSSLRTYSVLDRFEQPLSESVKAALGNHVPLCIVESNTTLGDQITRVLRFTIDGAPYFLLRDDKGGFIGATGERRMIRGAVVMGDTVEVAADRAIGFSPVQGSQIHLQRTESLQRVFRSEGRFYIRRLHTGEYGWVSPHAGLVSQKRVVQTGVSGNLNPEMRDRILSRITAANDAYRVLFDHFNSRTNARKSIPMWSCTSEGSTIRCTLSPPYDRTGELDESSAILVRDIEGILLGKPFQVDFGKGRIEITPKVPGLPTTAQ